MNKIVKTFRFILFLATPFSKKPACKINFQKQPSKSVNVFFVPYATFTVIYEEENRKILSEK